MKIEHDSLDLLYAEVRHLPILPKSEQNTLAIKAQGGDEKAREQLVKHNIKFVIAVAKTFQGRGMDLPDLVAEGYLGLLHAIDTYQSSHKAVFLTYVWYCVRRSIFDAIEKHADVIRKPARHLRLRNKVHKIRHTYRSIHDGRDLPLKVLATVLRKSETDLSEVMYGSYTVSIEECSNEASVSCLRNPEDEYIEQEEHLLLTSKLAELRRRVNCIHATEKDRKIFLLRHGLDEGDEYEMRTLKEVGDLTGVSYETVRSVVLKIEKRINALSASSPKPFFSRYKGIVIPKK